MRSQNEVIHRIIVLDPQFHQVQCAFFGWFSFLVNRPRLTITEPVGWPENSKGLVINYVAPGGRPQNRKAFCASAPQDLRTPTPFLRVETCFVPPTPFSMAKTSSFLGKTTPTLFLSPLQHGLNFFAPTPFSFL